MIPAYSVVLETCVLGGTRNLHLIFPEMGLFSDFPVYTPRGVHMLVSIQNNWMHKQIFGMRNRMILYHVYILGGWIS